MQYEEFVERVRSQGRLASRDDAARAITATLAVLRETLAGDPGAGLPQEIVDMLPEAYAGVLVGANPQLANQARIESGGESTRESGQ
jgi:uncharacterized protein (DUF2267 family)